MFYKEKLTEVMTWLGEQHNTIFLGQGVKYPGHSMYETLKGVPDDKKIELPVIEDSQLGMSIGLSLVGYIPVSIFPRVNFLFRAMDQLVNHLDKIEEMSHGEFKPFVIIRTMIGSTDPLDPSPQHRGDYTDVFRAATNKILVLKLREPEDIFKSYKWIYEQRKSAILIEIP